MDTMGQIECKYYFDSTLASGTSRTQLPVATISDLCSAPQAQWRRSGTRHQNSLSSSSSFSSSLSSPLPLISLLKILCSLRRLSLSLLDNRWTMLGNSARHRSLFAGNQRKDCGCERSRSIGIAQLLSQKVLRVCATFAPSILLLM